jgi:BirA family biotin operon repressor/biotin-[acetyl-CoA-carboxylase] ligase
MTEYQLFRILCDKGEFAFADTNQAHLFYDDLIKKGLEVSLDGNHLILNTPIIPLDIERIKDYLPAQSHYLLDALKIVYETDSTNKQLLSTNNTDILLAEYQSAGKGRLGKQWVSPMGHNIYLSIKYPYLLDKDISFLPLYISLQLAKVLNKAGIEGISIKWPNDLYLHNVKFSGSLLEACFSSKQIILGIGINVTMTDSYKNIIDQPYTSISQFYSHSLCDRNYLLAKILPNLYPLVNNFDLSLIDEYLNDYEHYNYLKGKSLMVIENNNTYVADYSSINKNGSLKVKLNGTYKDIYSADVSVRLSNNA